MILCRIWWWWAMTQRDKAVWGERLEDRGTRAGHGAAGFMSPRSVLRGDSLGAGSPRPGVRREVVWPCSRPAAVRVYPYPYPEALRVAITRQVRSSYVTFFVWFSLIRLVIKRSLTRHDLNVI